MTPQQALEILDQATSDSSLKLCRRDHALVGQALHTIAKVLETRPGANEQEATLAREVTVVADPLAAE